MRTRSKSPDVGSDLVLNHTEMLILAAAGFSEGESGTST